MPDVFDTLDEPKTDVFDEIAPSKGDLFDQVAEPTETEKAAASLADTRKLIRDTTELQQEQARKEADRATSVYGLANAGATALDVLSRTRPDLLVKSARDLAQLGTRKLLDLIPGMPETPPNAVTPRVLPPELVRSGREALNNILPTPQLPDNINAKPNPIDEATGRVVDEFISGMAEPENAMALGPVTRYPALARPLFQLPMIAEIPQATEELINAQTPAERAAAGLKLGAQVAMPALIERGLRTPPRMPAEAPANAPRAIPFPPEATGQDILAAKARADYIAEQKAALEAPAVSEPNKPTVAATVAAPAPVYHYENPESQAWWEKLDALNQEVQSKAGTPEMREARQRREAHNDLAYSPEGRAKRLAAKRIEAYNPLSAVNVSDSPWSTSIGSTDIEGWKFTGESGISEDGRAWRRVESPDGKKRGVVFSDTLHPLEEAQLTKNTGTKSKVTEPTPSEAKAPEVVQPTPAPKVFRDAAHAQEVVDLIEPMVKAGTAKPANLERLRQAKEFLGVTEEATPEVSAADSEAIGRAQGAVDSYQRTIINALQAELDATPKSNKIHRSTLQAALREKAAAIETARDLFRQKLPATELEERVKGLLIGQRGDMPELKYSKRIEPTPPAEAKPAEEAAVEPEFEVPKDITKAVVAKGTKFVIGDNLFEFTGKVDANGRHEFWQLDKRGKPKRYAGRTFTQDFPQHQVVQMVGDERFSPINPPTEQPAPAAKAQGETPKFTMTFEQFKSAPREGVLLDELRKLPREPKTPEQIAAEERDTKATEAIEKAGLSWIYDRSSNDPGTRSNIEANIRRLSKAKKKIIDEYEAALNAKIKAGNKGEEGQRRLYDKLVEKGVIQPPPEPPKAGAEGEIIGMGGAVPSEFENSPRTATGIKNATVDQERATRGLPPAIQPLRKDFGTVWDRAMAAIDRDPQVQDRLIESLRDHPRAITDEEDALLLHRQVDLQNEYGKATRDLAQAHDDGRTEDVAREKLRTAALSDQLLDLYNINKKAGTETARGLAARKMMAYEDFTLAKMELERRAVRGGAQLSDAERGEIVRLQKQIEDSQKAFDEYKQQQDQRTAELETRAVVAEMGKQAAERRLTAPVLAAAERVVKTLHTRADAARVRLKERLKRTSAGIDPTILLDVAEIGAEHLANVGYDFAKWSAKMVEDVGDWVQEHLPKIWEASQKVVDNLDLNATIKAQIKRGVPPTVEEVKTRISQKMKDGALDAVTSDVQKLVRRFAEEGVKDMNTMIDKVWDVLKGVDPEITRREAMDAISGYGKFKQLTKDEISVRVRDLKGQMQQVAKLEDMQAGQAPAKTGIERRTPSDEERRLIKQVNEAKKKGGFVVTDPTRQLASALTARKTYYRNRLSDLKQEIATREKVVKQSTPQPTDAQLEALKAEYKQVLEEHEQVFPKQAQPLTEEQRIAAASRGLDREIADLEKQIGSGNVMSKAGKPKVTSPALEAKRAQLEALREQRNELRDLNQEFQQQKATKALEQQQRALQENIAEKERKLREGDTAPQGQPVNRPASPELEALKQQRDALNKQLAEARKKPEGVRLAEQLAKRVEAMNKAIAEKEAKIASGNVAPSSRAMNRPLASPELETARQKLDALNKQIAEMRKSTKTPEERALQAYKTRLATAYAELTAKLAAKDYTTKPRRKLELDPEAMRLKARNERLKDQWLQEQAAERMKNRTWWEKVFDWGALYRRAGVLSSPTVVPKLISAGLQRLGGLPLEDLAGAGLRRIPGISEVAKRAPLEGGGLNLKSEVTGWKNAFTTGMKDAYQVLKTGKSDLDVLYGHGGESYTGESEVGGRLLTFFGRLHGMLKAPVKRAVFERSVQRLGDYYAKNKLDLTDDLLRTRIGVEAYQAANRAIFLQDNFVASKVSQFLSEKASKETGHATLGSKIWATAGRIALPIVKVPTNIVAETLQYAAGLGSGGTRLAVALAKGVDKLTPEQSDLIMRELKKGSIGFAVLALGYFNADAIGGYYQPGQKRKQGDVKAGRIRVYGADIPSWLLHNPLLETLQMGATIRRVADSKLRGQHDPQGVGAGMLAGALGVVEEAPFVREMVELDKLHDPEKRGQFLNEQAKSILIPSLVQRTAEWMDNGVKRKPHTIGQTLESGIPGLRENVPTR